MSIVTLPQCKIFFSYNIFNEFVLISGGRQPNSNFFKNLSNNRKIIAIDKGINICHDLNIAPEFLIGDFDSANSSSINWAEKNFPIYKFPVDKDLTDTQLALNLFNDENFLILTGIFGGRTDHLFSNIFTCANSNSKICLVDDKELIFFLKNEDSCKIKFFTNPQNLSLLPITEIVEGVNLKNVHWELENATLKQNFPNAISNRVESDEISIGIKNGILAVYIFFGDEVW